MSVIGREAPMKAVLLPGEREVRVVERERPRPGFGEVLVRMRASALCPSDIRMYNGARHAGGGDHCGPVVPGHEPAGDVAELGDGVTGVAVGDRVAVYLAVGCGTCAYCAAGDRMLCPEWKRVGFDIDGGDADYMVVPAVNCLKLPDAMSYEVGAVVTDVVGTQYHAQKRLQVCGTDTVAVFGIGPLGAAGILVGTGRGARVIAVDCVPDRLEMALELGAHEVIDVTQEDAAERLLELTCGEGVDVAVECSGAQHAQDSALEAARRRGRVAFIGESRETTLNPSDHMIRKALTVIGGWYFPLGEFREIARFVVGRGLCVDRMITHRFSIDEAETAFRMFDARETEKAVFVWDAAA